MREGDRENVDLRLGREREVRALARRATKERVDESGRAAFAGFPRELDGVVDDRGGGDPVEVQQLEETDAQDGEHFGVEAGGRPAPEGLDDVIEGGPPPKRAGRGLPRERAIAFVREP